jgi:hypothetical protein
MGRRSRASDWKERQVMRVRAGRGLAAVVLGAMLGAGGCAAGSTATASAPSTPAAVEPSAPPASIPVAATPSVRMEPTGRTSPAGTEPPTASLSAEGGEPVAGQLGSFTWQDGGSDSPWLPGTAIRVGAGEPLTVVLAGDVGVAEWTARRVPAGTTDGSGAVGLGSGPAPIAFAAPAVGSWSVQVTVRFADNMGDATYYWAVEAR